MLTYLGPLPLRQHCKLASNLVKLQLCISITHYYFEWQTNRIHVRLNFTQHFSVPFSRYLPEIGRAVLFYGAANAGVKAIVKKRKDRVAFLTCGWLEFAGKYALQEGGVYVLTLRIVHGRFLLTFDWPPYAET